MRTLYISDLDGTLLNSRKEITDYSSEIINSCIASGVLFSIATARMPYGCDYRLQKLHLQVPAILTNGVFLYDFSTKKYLHAEVIDQEAAEKVISAFEENKRDCFLYLFQDEEISICYGNDKLKEQEQYYSIRAQESCKKIYRTDDYRKEMACGAVVYFALTGEKKELDPVCKSLDKISGIHYACYLNIYNNQYCLEVFSDKASKKNALLRLKAMLNYDELVVFGDNWNDMPMIDIADRSYAPENALPEIKKVVTAVLESCNNDGVAKFLKNEWEQRQLDNTRLRR